ncbi:hypothetical protein [Opitutus terrae]|uniref:Uncharacterized protein n=1 Tax=Opitutus terrae (strain DSM 11246 / JCM 15787 / PB90-1) TaxID=452637 RepID=B1ZNN3_OPITP|nr:hypothetical protein [Opitutus terrae]ACB74463.1 hypothetical protein Oter_1176 [Opitutus terrae PB90-1]
MSRVISVFERISQNGDALRGCCSAWPSREAFVLSSILIPVTVFTIAAGGLAAAGRLPSSVYFVVWSGTFLGDVLRFFTGRYSSVESEDGVHDQEAVIC